MLNHNKTANGGLVFSYSIFSYQKLLSFLFVCSLQAFPIFVRQSTVAIRKSPGIRMIHQDPVISALSDRDSILPQVITNSHKAQCSLRDHCSSYIHDYHKHDRWEEVWYQMLPQNTEEPCSHTFCCDDVLAVSNLSNLGTYYFCNTGPAGHADYKRQAEDVRISQDSLQ